MDSLGSWRRSASIDVTPDEIGSRNFGGVVASLEEDVVEPDPVAQLRDVPGNFLQKSASKYLHSSRNGHRKGAGK